MLHRPLLAALALALAPACAAAIDDPGTPGPADQPTLADTLDQPIALAIEPGAAGSSGASVVVTVPSKDDPIELPVSITGGALAIELVDGYLVLHELTITTDAVKLPDEVIPGGASLTAIELAIAAPMGGELTALDDDLAVAELPVTAQIRWSLMLDGTSHELAPITLSGCELAVVAELIEGELQVHLAGGQDGELWSWLDRFALSDLALHVTASGQPTGLTE